MIAQNVKPPLHPICQRALGSVSALQEDQKEEHVNRLIKLVIDFDDVLDLLQKLEDLLSTSGNGTKQTAHSLIETYLKEHGHDV